MHEAFEVHMLTDHGKTQATLIAEAFDGLLDLLSPIVGEGRELALVRTKLEEACFFAKKGMARSNSLDGGEVRA